MYKRFEIQAFKERKYIAFASESKDNNQIVILIEDDSSSKSSLPEPVLPDNLAVLNTKPDIIIVKPAQLKRNHHNLEEIDFEASVDAYVEGEYNTQKTLKQPTAFIPSISQINDRNKPLPSSANQARLLLLSNESAQISTSYNMPIAIHIKGEIKVDILNSALRKLIQRHESLRTSFIYKENEFYQLIGSPEIANNWNIKQIELTTAEYEDEKFKELMVQYANEPFNTETAPLMRGYIFYYQARSEYYFLIVIHHCVFDGHSQVIFFNELTNIYQALITNTEVKLDELPIQYTDYAQWQKNIVTQSNSIKAQVEYWKDALKDCDRTELLPDLPISTQNIYNGQRKFISLSKAHLSKLNDLASALKVNLYTILLAALQCLLLQFTQQRDILIGTVTANRSKEPIKKQIKNVIGFFANIIPFKVKFPAHELTFDELIELVHAQIKSCIYDNSDIPFNQIVSGANVARQNNRNPIFDIFFVLQRENYYQAPFNKHDSLQLSATIMQVDWKTSKFPLSLELCPTSEGLKGFFEFNTSWYTLETVSRLAAYFEKLLIAITSNPTSTLINEYFSLIDADEKLIKSWALPIQQIQFKENNIIQLVNQIAISYPDHAGLIFQQKNGDIKTFSYSEIFNIANTLAEYLVEEAQLIPGSFIGICLPRSVAMIIACLSCLIIDCTIIPLETKSDETKLLNEKINSSKLSTIITLQPLFDTLLDNNSRALIKNKIILLETGNISEDECWVNPDVSNAQSKNRGLIYIIYSSGSTGDSKGIIIKHAGLINWSYFLKTKFQNFFDKDTKIFIGAALTFDASFWEIFCLGLTQANTIVLNSDIARTDAKAVTELCNKQHITIATFLPKFARRLNPSDFSSLKLVFLIGETVNENDITPWLKAQITVVVGYGPTEVTAGPTIKIYNPEETVLNKPTIGNAIDNMQIHILNKSGKHVPIGAPGEIYISGIGLADGYLNNSELTTNSFVTIKDIYRNSIRAFKSGDQGRFLANGEIDFLGRTNGDRQVKINGIRIELSGIEACLRKHANIKDAFINTYQKANNILLVAFIVTKDGNKISDRELRAFLLTQPLRISVIPKQYLFLSELPLTINGKINIKSLPRVTLTESNNIIQPSTENEKKLQIVWGKVLKLTDHTHISITDDFFAIGGDSFSFSEIYGYIKNEFKIEIPLKNIYAEPTIQNLALIIEQLTNQPNFNNKMTLH